jgi:pyruvoyl-dependent arginine decarboxylase (PvlArgDC)
MPASTLRSVLPVTTSVVAALWLATAVPHGMVPEVAAARLALDAGAQTGRCVAGGRDTHGCLAEADGTALVERAEWLARDDAASRQASRQ